MVIGIEASRANRKEKTGTESYAHNIIRTMTGLDRESVFWLYTDTPLEPSLAHLGNNVHERILRWPPLYLWNQLRLSMEMAIAKPDVLFLPAHTLPIIHPKATVTTLHDVGFDRAPELYARKELTYHRWAVRFALKHARTIITPSVFTKQEILEIYPGAHKREKDIVPIHHGFRPEELHPIADKSLINKVLERYGIHPPYFFYIGRLQEKKNIPGLVEAFGRLLARRKEYHDVQLVLAGQPDYGYDRILSLVDRYHVKDNVIFPGFVAQQDYPLMMNGALAFTFPSLYEGFGLPVLEAQACGTPVLTSTEASLPEIAGDGALFVDGKSLDAMATGLETMLSDASMRETLTQKGFENLKRFDWHRCGEKTLAELKKAAS